jgi:Uma2 family endonuclease
LAASPHAAFVPVEVYLRTSYEPDAEYVDGVIEERPMGQNDHSAWQNAIALWFSQKAKEWGIRVRPELRVRVARTNYRVPDVVLLDRNLPPEPIATHPPIAVFEVLSPEDSLSRMMVKLGDYERMGIPTILVLDPEAGNHRRYVGGRLEPLPAGRFELTGSDCQFDLAEIEKLLD